MLFEQALEDVVQRAVGVGGDEDCLFEEVSLENEFDDELCFASARHALN